MEVMLDNKNDKSILFVVWSIVIRQALKKNILTGGEMYYSQEEFGDPSAELTFILCFTIDKLIPIQLPNDG